MTNYHPVVEIIKNLLDTHSAEFESFEHDPVRTSEEASQVRTGYTLEQGAKAIIIRGKDADKNQKFVMLVLSGSRRFDSKKVKRLCALSDIRFATEAEVAEVTGGVLPGGVPPFGNIFHLDIYADTALFQNERIIFNAGDRSYSIGMKSSDYLTIVKPQVADIAQ
jgi:prolyl-tRNA editing enzyme YbaK/EbsC (Cys-tRNA(Pro) deacylase)